MTERNWGQNNQYSALTEHNMVAFQIAQALRAISTATICKVVKCSSAGQVGPIGTLSALPMVDLVDGLMQASQHVNVLNLPYMRMQAGSKAIIMDPKAGDLGLVVFADRDISAVKKEKKQTSPGSKRRFNMADGMYVGTVLSIGNPSSYIQFEDDGSIKISPDGGTTFVHLKIDGTALVTAPTKIVVDCPSILLGSATANRPVAAEGTTTTDGASLNGNFLTKVLGE